MRTTRRRSLLTALAASALIVTACGSEEDADDEPVATEAGTTQAAPETTEAAPETAAAPETTEAAPETAQAAPETTQAAPETTEAAPETTQAAPETTDGDGSDSQPTDTEPEQAATGPVPPEPPADFTGDRLTIFTTFTDPGLISQDVVFEPVCLETWVRSIPEAELPLFADPSTEESAFAPESLELANELYGCLDVVYLGDEYARSFGLDSSCVIEQFVMLDLAAFVAEQGRDIDLVFGHLADTAAQCE